MVRARSALFTLFGDVVRPAGGEAWLTTLTECMGALDYTPEATRTALHRMSAEGWVAPRRVGRYAAYRLTPKGVDRLEEAAARIYRLKTGAWDGRWRLVVGLDTSAAPELERELRWMGYGQLDAAVWVSPHEHGDRFAQVLSSHRVHGTLTSFMADALDGDAELARRAWDLHGLASAYSGFADQWAAEAVPSRAAESFALRVRMVHEWRKFLFVDPGLPAELLPADWAGHRAAALFHKRYDDVHEAAWDYYEGLVRSAPATPGDIGPLIRRPEQSPFARGLAALQTTTTEQEVSAS